MKRRKSSTQSLRIVVTGLIAQHPVLGGVSWDYVQYPLGLLRLGHDVFYLEDSGEWPYSLDGGVSGDGWIAYDCSRNVEHLRSVMTRFGMGDRWAYRFPIKPRWFGLSDSKRREVLRTADLLINVSGTLKRPLDYRGIPRLAYVDSDPVFTQVKLALPRGQLKFQRRVAAHDVHFSFGECLAATDLASQYEWQPTRQPIVLSEWAGAGAPGPSYTTIMNWTSYKPLRYQGRDYGQKDVEFRRFIDLPGRLPNTSFEVALSANEHVAWQTGSVPASDSGLSAAEILRRRGWGVVDAHQVCMGLDRYREYIHGSRAEWSVAKGGYVLGRSGWFSCRTACYLAAGRPAIVEHTGFEKVIPTGVGLLTFSNPDEAVAAVEAVQADYPRHARVARELSSSYFDSDVVLAGFVDRAMAVSSPRMEVLS